MGELYQQLACDWWRHPKVVGLSLPARGLWASAFTYAGDNGTGGRVPAGAWQSIAPGVRPTTIEKLIQECVDAGLFERENGSILFHNWRQTPLDHIRELQRIRQQKHRARIREGKDVTQTVTPASRGSRSHARGETETEKEPPVIPHGEQPVLTVVASTDAKAKRVNRDAAMLEAFQGVWNLACAPLPTLRKPPAGREALRLVRQAWDQADGDLALLERAIRAAAANPDYQERRWDYQTFCRKIDRWIGVADQPARVAGSTWD